MRPIEQLVAAARGCGLSTKEDAEIGYRASLTPAVDQRAPCRDIADPKDVFGAKKLSLGLLPSTGKIYGALAIHSGSKKYGAYNWRNKKVRMSIYLDAIERHLLAMRDGQDVDEESKVPHLGHIIANASILADAEQCGRLVDDRPGFGPAAKLLKQYTEE